MRTVARKARPGDIPPSVLYTPEPGRVRIALREHRSHIVSWGFVLVFVLVFIGLPIISGVTSPSPSPASQARNDVQSACQGYRQYLNSKSVDNTDIQAALSQAQTAAQLDPRRWTQFKNDIQTVALRVSNIIDAGATGDLGAVANAYLPDNPAGDARLKKECHG